MRQSYCIAQMVLDSGQFPCFSILNTGIKGMCHHTQQQLLFEKKKLLFVTLQACIPADPVTQFRFLQSLFSHLCNRVTITAGQGGKSDAFLVMPVA